MTTGTVIAEGLNAIFLALTPVERWQAVRRFDTNFTIESWFTLITVAVLIILIALFLWVSHKRRVEVRKIAEQLFIDYAEKRGLSARERQILLEVVSNSRLKRRDAIFTLKDAFDRGATRLIDQSLAANQTAEENEQLRADLSFLREKLGFPLPNLTGLPVKPKRLSSRHIPVGRELYITPCRSRRSASIESTVIKNDDMELTLKLTIPIEIEPGEYWRARFYLSGSVWEFDSPVVRCEGDVMVLNHSDNVRFINLRRFLRVPVNKPAFVARFPFTRLANTSGDCWNPPEFVPAVVTELAGLSLRLDVPLEVKVGERVLVMFKLDEQKNQESSTPKAGKKTTSKIIQDISEVRHTQAIKNGFSIAVELIGLSDSDINELVCATNAAKRRADAQRQDISSPSNDMQPEEKESVAEPAAAQGA
ncbi:MAG: hypothetical protein ACETVZ_06120 [Phycisphaerae bacterium]